MELLDQTKTNGEEMMAEVGLPRDVYTDQEVFIKTVREGVSGRILQQVVYALPSDRNVFVRLLETNSSNLHRFYKRKSLGRAQSEEVLDTIKLYVEAEKVFGDREIAEDWLHTPVPALSGSRPVDLFDTFAGRGMVRQALRKISFGEFS